MNTSLEIPQNHFTTIHMSYVNFDKKALLNNKKVFIICLTVFKKENVKLYKIWASTWQNQQNVCAPSEDSDQPRHPPSLIRVFAVRMKKAWVLSYPLRASEDSDQNRRMPRLIWVFAGRTVTLLVLSCRGSYTNYLSSMHAWSCQADYGADKNSLGKTCLGSWNAYRLTGKNWYF